MIRLHKILYFVFVFAALTPLPQAFAQDSAKTTVIISSNYFLDAAQTPFIVVSAKTKINKRFTPVNDLKIALYLDEKSDKHLLGNLVTNNKGEATVYIPASFKLLWDSTASHNFIAVADVQKNFEAAESETTITKAKLEIDTATDGSTKNITVKVLENAGGVWVAAGNTDVKISVKRLGGLLNIGDQETYTSDSATGEVTAEFMKDSLPGDSAGNIIIVASTPDNDKFGNLYAEKKVNWGMPAKPNNTAFNQRSLFATRDKAPVWLLLLVYSIIAGVWGTIIYLFILIARIRKLGKETK